MQAAQTTKHDRLKAHIQIQTGRKLLHVEITTLHHSRVQLELHRDRPRPVRSRRFSRRVARCNAHLPPPRFFKFLLKLVYVRTVSYLADT